MPEYLIELQPGEVMRIPHGFRIGIKTGALWLTRTGDRWDHFLLGGERWGDIADERRLPVLIEAIAENGPTLLCIDRAPGRLVRWLEQMQLRRRPLRLAMHRGVPAGA